MKSMKMSTLTCNKEDFFKEYIPFSGCFFRQNLNWEPDFNRAKEIVSISQDLHDLTIKAGFEYFACRQ